MTATPRPAWLVAVTVGPNVRDLRIHIPKARR